MTTDAFFHVLSLCGGYRPYIYLSQMSKLRIDLNLIAFVNLQYRDHLVFQNLLYNIMLHSYCTLQTSLTHFQRGTDVDDQYGLWSSSNLLFIPQR